VINGIFVEVSLNCNLFKMRIGKINLKFGPLFFIIAYAVNILGYCLSCRLSNIRISDWFLVGLISMALIHMVGIFVTRRQKIREKENLTLDND
jgi:hypothetical protein